MISRKHWFAKPTIFNDPFEFKLKTPTEQNLVKGITVLRKDNPHLIRLTDYEILLVAQQNLQTEINDFGIVCFTEEKDNILMWSHYTNCHNGICLGFEIDDSQMEIRKIEYSQNYPDLDFEDIWSASGTMKILLTKSIEWQYEKEWRSIKVTGNELKGYSGKLVGVIFGCRTAKMRLKKY